MTTVVDPQPPLFELSAVNRVYGRGAERVHAVRDVDLVVRDGERVGVCGHKYHEKVFFTRFNQGLFYPCSYKPLIRGNAASGPAFA